MSTLFNPISFSPHAQTISHTLVFSIATYKIQHIGEPVLAPVLDTVLRAAQSFLAEKLLCDGGDWRTSVHVFLCRQYRNRAL